jgi:hypothetical protein
MNVIGNFLIQLKPGHKGNLKNDLVNRQGGEATYKIESRFFTL